MAGSSEPKTKRRRLKPEQIEQIVALRAVGYTYSAIAERVGVSVRSVERHSKDVTRASISAEVRASVVADLAKQTDTKSLQRELQLLVCNRLAIGKQLLEAVDQLTDKLSTAIPDAHALDLANHALTVQKLSTAYQTLVKSVDVAIDRDSIAEPDEHITSISIVEMTAEQVMEAKRRAAEQAGYTPEPELVLSTGPSVADSGDAEVNATKLQV